jgi:uncharacterized protein YrzB (UPF0473 family)
MGRDDEGEDDEVVVLTTEDGEELAFEVLGVLEVDGKEYALLTPSDEAEDPEGIDVHIFSYDQKDDGTEVFSDIDDAVFEKVRAAAERMFGGEDDEDEDEDEDDEGKRGEGGGAPDA